MAEQIRLQAALARQGFCSRRAAKKLIKSGQVAVNGRLVLAPGARVNPESDKITVQGRKAQKRERIVLLLNKPEETVCTLRDKYARRTVLDVIPSAFGRIYPVGRLDKDTTGLLLLTNDGNLAYRLMHPRFGVLKGYQVWIRGNISRAKIKELQKGILLEGKKTYPCRIKISLRKKTTERLYVELSEGRKRQIKKMFKTAGHPVSAIKRIRFGPLRLAGLGPGRWRRLSKEEIRQLERAGKWTA